MQWTDVLGLKGNPADGVPGVKGIGPVAARKLLVQHGSLDALIAAAPQVAACDCSSWNCQRFMRWPPCVRGLLLCGRLRC